MRPIVRASGVRPNSLQLQCERLEPRQLLTAGQGVSPTWPLLQANLDADLGRAWVFANALAGTEAIISGEFGGALSSAEAGQVAATLDVDADGWPRGLPSFGSRQSVLWSAPRYHVADVADPAAPGQMLEAVLHGVWVLTWEGTGDVRLESSRQDDGADGSPDGGYQMLRREERRLVLLIRDRFLGPVVTVRSSEPGDHVRNLRLWAPRFDGAGLDLSPASPLGRGTIASSLEPAPGQPEPVFHPVYLAHLEDMPAAVVRPMDWYRINDNHDEHPIDWSDRAGARYALAALNVADATWSRYPVGRFRQRVGLPYERLVELANHTGKDLWINIPHTASIDFIRGLAGYLAGPAGLHPERRVWVEYSNEIWNPIGAYLPQVRQARAEAAAHFSLPLEQVPELGPGHAWGSGTLQARALGVFEEAWLAGGGTDERLVNVLAGFVSLPAFNEQVIAAARGVEPELAEVFAVTSYFGHGTQEEIWNLHWAAYADGGFAPDFTAGPHRWREEDLFARAAAIVRRDLHATAPAWAANVALAAGAALPLVGYEGGQHMLVGGRGDWGNPLDADFMRFHEAFNYHPQMGGLITEQFALWTAAGAETAAIFTDVGRYSYFGYWGAKTSVLHSRDDSPKWDAILAWAETQAGVRPRSNPVGGRPSLAAATIRGEAAQLLATTISASGGEGGVALVHLAGELPPGVTFTATAAGTAVVAGTPTASGRFRIVVRALDADGDADYLVYEILVDPEGTARGGLVRFTGGAIPASIRPGGPAHENGRYDPVRPWIEERTADGRKRQFVPFDAGPTGQFFAGEYNGSPNVIAPSSPLNFSGGMALTSGPDGDLPYVGLRDGAFRSYTGDASAAHSFDLFAVWRREQFAGFTPGSRVRFGTAAAAATLRVDFTSLAETASNLRFAILAREPDGSDVWHISEAVHDRTVVGEGFFELSGFAGSSTAGKRWAVINPGPTLFAMPAAAGLSFVPLTFDDVRAVALVYRGEKWRYHDEFAFTQFLAIGQIDAVVEVDEGVQVDRTARSGVTRFVKRGQGALILDLANTHAGGTIVEAGEVIVRNPLGLGSGGLVVQPGARLTLDVGTRRVSLPAMTVADTGTLDLGTGSIVISAGGYDPAGLRGLILSGRNNGTWTGSGIASGSMPGVAFREVGYRVLPDGSAIVGFSAVGDANMDGSVSVQDLIALNAGGLYGTAVTDAGWWQGDFNYDGRVNVTDLIALVSSGLYGAGSYLPTALTAVSDLQATGAATPSLSALSAGFTLIGSPTPASRPGPVLTATTAAKARAADARRVDEFAWAALAKQAEQEDPKDRKVSRWRLVGP